MYRRTVKLIEKFRIALQFIDLMLDLQELYIRREREKFDETVSNAMALVREHKYEGVLIPMKYLNAENLTAIYWSECKGPDEAGDLFIPNPEE